MGKENVLGKWKLLRYTYARSRCLSIFYSGHATRHISVQLSAVLADLISIAPVQNRSDF